MAKYNFEFKKQLVNEYLTCKDNYEHSFINLSYSSEIRISRLSKTIFFVLQKMSCHDIS